LSALGCRGGGRVVLLPAVRRRRRGWGWCRCLGDHPRSEEEFFRFAETASAISTPSATKRPAARSSDATKKYAAGATAEAYLRGSD